MDRCPCKDCICIPICRNKDYVDLFNDCYLLDKYTSSKSKYVVLRDEKKIYKIQDILKPNAWLFRKSGKSGHPMVFKKTLNSSGQIEIKNYNDYSLDFDYAEYE
jgi:hypothetical protein